VGYDPELVARRWKGDATNALLLAVADRAGSSPEVWEADAIEEELKQAAAQLGVKQGEIMMPLRIALTGSGAGPGVAGMLALFGRTESIRRIREAVSRITAQTDTP
jgi:glutamyl-tRNA synthetase